MKTLSALIGVFLCFEIFSQQTAGQSSFPTVCNNTVLSNGDTGGICNNIDVCIGWRVRNGICYKKFETNTNWNGAVGLCENENAYLAEIPNIYVNNRINYLVSRDECWIGLSTSSSDYSWRIGNFSLSDPTTAVALNNEDKNKCGTIGVDRGNRWDLRDCSNTQICAVCMKGPLKSENPPGACKRFNTHIIVDRGICYRNIVRRNTELDLAVLFCNRLNGELYMFNEAEPNLRLINIFDSFYEHNVYPKLLPNQSNLFTPQDGYFNLLTSNVNLTTPVKCLRLINSELQEVNRNNVNFICKIEYEPDKRILERTLTNDTCYWSVSGNSNWTEAETECATKGGHLVEIFNDDTQDITVSLIATEQEYLDELYWIGIGEYVNSSSQWRSGASIVFSNFSITTTYLDSRCVAIDQSGSWYILDCENRYSFVCGKNLTGVDNSPCPYPITATAPIQNTTQPTDATTQASTTQPTDATTQANTTQPTNATTQATTTQTLNTLQNEDAIDCNIESFDNPTCETLNETSKEDRTDHSTLQGIEMFVQNLLNNISVTTDEIFEFKIPKIQTDLIAFGYNRSRNTNINIGQTKLKINKGSFPAGTTVIIANSDNKTLIDNTNAQILATGESVKIASNLITIVASGILIGELTIEFPIEASDFEGESLTCYSFNPDGSLNNTGIRTVINNNTVECITTHLTTFAVLVTFSATSDVDTEVQAYISVALCGLSLFALLITVLLYACIGKKFFKEDINIIQLNYVLSLIFALISFLLLSIAFFAKITFEPIICTTITLLNHYTWLSVFSWNFCQAIHIVFALFSNKLPFKRHYLLMLAVGWGLPIPIVIITFGVGVAKNEYFDTVANLCFLNIKNGFVWALLGPIYIIILINLTVLFVVICISFYVQRKRTNKSYVCRLIIGIGTTIPLLGLPWILGLLPNIAGLTNNAELSWLSYIFVILNASQGIIFFVVHVIRNADVRALCSSGEEKAQIDIKLDDKKEEKQREEMEGRLRGTEGQYTNKREVAPMYFTQSTEVNVLYQNEHVDS